MRLVVLRLLGVMPLEEEIIMKSCLFLFSELPDHKQAICSTHHSCLDLTPQQRLEATVGLPGLKLEASITMSENKPFLVIIIAGILLQSWEAD